MNSDFEHELLTRLATIESTLAQQTAMLKRLNDVVFDDGEVGLIQRVHALEGRWQAAKWVVGAVCGALGFAAEAVLKYLFH